MGWAGSEVAQRTQAGEATLGGKGWLVVVVNESGDVHTGGESGGQDDLRMTATTDQNERRLGQTDMVNGAGHVGISVFGGVRRERWMHRDGYRRRRG